MPSQEVAKAQAEAAAAASKEREELLLREQQLLAKQKELELGAAQAAAQVSDWSKLPACGRRGDRGGERCHRHLHTTDPVARATSCVLRPASSVVRL